MKKNLGSVEFSDIIKILQELEQINQENLKDFLGIAGEGPDILPKGVGEIAEEAKREAEETVNEILFAALERESKDIIATPKPLTLKESKAVDDKIEQLIGATKNCQKKKDLLLDHLRKRIVEKGNDFELLIEKRKKLRKACKRVFGKKLDKITYDQYMQARKIRDKISKQEGQSFFDKGESNGVSKMMKKVRNSSKGKNKRRR